MKRVIMCFRHAALYFLIICLMLSGTLYGKRSDISEDKRRKLLEKINRMSDQQLLKKLKAPETSALGPIVDEIGRRRVLEAKDFLEELRKKAIAILESDKKKGIILKPHPNEVVEILPRVRFALLRLKLGNDGIAAGKEEFKKCLEYLRDGGREQEYYGLLYVNFRENPTEMSSIVLDTIKLERPENDKILMTMLNLAKDIPGEEKNKVVKQIIFGEKYQNGNRVRAIMIYDYSSDNNGLDMLGKLLKNSDYSLSRVAFNKSKKVVDKLKYEKWVQKYLPDIPHKEVRKLITDYVEDIKKSKRTQKNSVKQSSNSSIGQKQHNPIRDSSKVENGLELENKELDGLWIYVIIAGLIIIGIFILVIRKKT